MLPAFRVVLVAWRFRFDRESAAADEPAIHTIRRGPGWYEASRYSRRYPRALQRPPSAGPEDRQSRSLPERHPCCYCKRPARAGRCPRRGAKRRQTWLPRRFAHQALESQIARIAPSRTPISEHRDDGFILHLSRQFLGLLDRDSLTERSAVDMLLQSGERRERSSVRADRGGPQACLRGSNRTPFLS
jgi:hypothetical protein